MINTRLRRLFTIALSILILLGAALSARAMSLPDQRQMFKAQLDDTEYRLALGAIKKINGANVVDREIVLRGDIRRSTYEFDRAITPNEAWQMLVDSLPGERRALFACDGLTCGSSNG